jgi:hypothetical protein
MLGLHYETDFLSEKEKDSEDYLVNCIDLAIAELVIEKDHLRKAYNYYQGERDRDQFKFLEENYNIGNPTSVEFIPLIRRHVDALVGEHLQNKIKPKISCKDKDTISAIATQKTSAVNDAEINALKSQLYANIQHAFQAEEDKGKLTPPSDDANEFALEQLKSNVTKNFISSFEIAAQDVLLHLTQSKRVDLFHKRKLLFLDILIAGQCFYKVEVINKGETPRIEVLNPFDVFFDKNPNSPYVKTSPRVVHRRWMYRDQILAKYGEYLTKDDLKELATIQPAYLNNDFFYIRSESGSLVSNSSSALSTTLPYMDGRGYSYTLIPVYEVEWLSANKDKTEDGKTVYRTDRYAGVRIGQDIYVNMGKVDDVTRSVENPYECFNSINGIFYSDRNGKPYSLVLATANLQDKYDILHFHRDNLIANSGVKGDWVDYANLPTFLGATPAERLLKFKAYKKQGIALINTAQEGRGANHNTVFAGYDDTVDGRSIQAIQLAIQQTEDICSSITGVFRERLGAIEQQDAVTNVDVGIKQSAIITKQYYQVMDNITTELLLDGLNACKDSYKEGMVGSIILGDGMQKIFTIDPKNFSFTDYDVNIADSGDVIRDMQKIEQLTLELIKSGQADIDIIFESVATESLTEMKQQVLQAFAKKKQEMGQMQQMQQQLLQLQEQLKQAQQQGQKLSSENQVLKSKSTDLEEKAIDYDYEVRKESNRNTKQFNDQKTELDQQRLNVEKLELIDDNPNNDRVKGNKV